MSNESEQALRGQLEVLQKERVKAARRCAMMFGTVSIIAVLFFVYGYVQRVEAGRSREESMRQREIAGAAKMEADRNAEEAHRLQGMIDSARDLAERSEERAAAAEARLAECRKRK